MSAIRQTDVAVIGAGPAGSMAAARLRQLGWQVTVMERSHFPRFSIGESLLPQCMEWLEETGMLEPLRAANMQIKRGACFSHGEAYGELDYRKQFSSGWTWTWQVQRARFDDILARQAEALGAELRFGETIESVHFDRPGEPRLSVLAESGERYQLHARFVCDASGFARVLPRLLDLEEASGQPPRAALFTHVEDRISSADYRRDCIMLSYHPVHHDVWFWLIPFADGRASLGVTGNPDILLPEGSDPATRLRQLVFEEPYLARWLEQAVFDDAVRSIVNYSARAKSLYGDDFALLGNAGDFIDPVFSSGVALAMKSSMLAAELIDRRFRGEQADWESEFSLPLRAGSDVFREFVNCWYSGELQAVFFNKRPDEDIKAMLSSVLAGYVWDEKNPYNSKTRRRLKALCRACAEQ